MARQGQAAQPGPGSKQVQRGLLRGCAPLLKPQGRLAHLLRRQDGYAKLPAQPPVLEAFGLRRVDPENFVRAQSVPLALEALARQGVAPDRATVALRGVRADREM